MIFRRMALFPYNILYSCGLQISFMRICRPFLIYPVFIPSGFYSGPHRLTGMISC